MITSFIHFKDLYLNSTEIHSYQEGLKPKISSYEANELSSRLTDSTKVVILIPSQLFGFMEYENQAGHKGEILKASALSQVEERLISDISSLTFFYNSDSQLASWIDSSLFEFIVKNLDGLDAEITIIPEHFLIQGSGDAIILRENSFILAFSNSSGFGGSTEILSDYLETIDGDTFDKNNFLLFADAASAALYFPENKKVEHKTLEDLHHKLLESKNLTKWNLFQRKLSFSFLKAKLKLNSRESYFIAASVITILIAPLMISSVLSSSISSYQSNTIQIFQQLNPNFKRLINPKAQIDDLTRDIPSYATISSNNLEVLSYIETLADESIQDININFDDRVIEASVENLSPTKLSFFQELIKSQSGNVNTNGLSKGADGLNGNLIIYYDSE